MEDDSVEATARPAKKLGIAITAVGGVALIAMIWAGLSAAGDESEESEPNYTAAIETCRDAVRPMLKDPESAEFSDETYSKNEDGVRWRIRGSVRATNSFGATTPNSYECVAAWGGEEFAAEVTQLG